MRDVVAVFLLFATLAAAQTAPPAFEAASVKPGDPDNLEVSLLRRGGRFTATNVTLHELIAAAYEVRDNQVFGGPSWLDSEKFNVEAKAADATPSTNPAGPMLQSLLADRFKLSVHKEIRVQDVYYLVVSKTGSKLKDANNPAKGPMLRVGRGQITGTSAPVSLLTRPLSQQLGRSIIDKTGLNGKYDFTLEWTPDALFDVRPRSPATVQSPPDEKYASIFTTIQEQLGLRLESTKGPVEVIVVDHAERPDPN